MARWIRRLFLLLLIGGGAIVALKAMKQRQRAGQNAEPAPQWPPFEPRIVGTPQATPAAEIAGLVEVVEEVPLWLPAVEGACPDGYPIKANNNSRIFHVPGGRFYDRTVPERCYATADAAERDGYRQAKA